MRNYPLPIQPHNDNDLESPIKNPARGEGEINRPGGSPVLYAHIILQVESNPEMNGCFMLWDIAENPHGWEYRILDESLEYIYLALCEVIRKGAESDSIRPISFCYQNTNIRIIGGSEHDFHSTLGAWQSAIHLALINALKIAN
jgi:hypothetical protein